MKTLARKSQHKASTYLRRKHRTNIVIKSTSDKPRLVVNRSNVYIYAQIIGEGGKVLAVANDKAIKKGTKSERAFQVGEALAKAATKNHITDVVFDRNGYLFHGRVKQLAEGARSGGLNF